MKKIFTLIAALAVVGTAAAQSSWSFGPKVGINIANLHSSNGPEKDAIDGVKGALVAGAFVEYRMSNLFALSADVLYSRKGALCETEYQDGLSSANIKRKIENKFAYIDVPIMANFYIAKGFALKAGVQPSFLVSGKLREKISVYNTDIANNSDNTKDIKDDMHAVEFAMPIGLSYTFDCGLILDARYNIPFTDVFKDKSLYVGKIKSQVGSITVGWKF